MNRSRLVLFDIDGTLLLTAGAGRRAITMALSEHVGDGHAFTDVRFDGKTDPQIVTELLAIAGHAPPHEAERIEALCRRYVALLEHELASPEASTVLMPGVRPLLARLAAEPGVLLGLLTGNVREGAALKLRSGGLDPAQFVVGAFGSDSAHRPDLPAVAARRAHAVLGHEPSGDTVVIIGDTPADIHCGRGIGARAIAVATGAYSVQELSGHEPHAVFADLADTDAVVRAILE